MNLVAPDHRISAGLHDFERGHGLDAARKAWGRGCRSNDNAPIVKVTRCL